MGRIFKIFLLFLVFAGNAEAKLRWTPIVTPDKIIRVVGGESLKNYWVLDEHNVIFHFNEDKWIAYPSHLFFSEYQTRIYNPILISENHLIVLLTDLDWKTHFAEIKEGKITYNNFTSRFPIHGILNVKGTLYATGDFGSIYKLENSSWKEIPSPIKTHIISTEYDHKGDLWLGTKGEGIFSWNGKEFYSYSVPKEITKSTLTDIKCLNDSVYFCTSNNIIYTLINKQAYQITSNQSPFLNSLSLLSNGYYKIISKSKKTRFIPFLYRIKSFKELNDGRSALLLTQNSELYYDQEYDGNFFLDQASIVGLEGPDFSFEGFDLEPNDGHLRFYTRLRPGIILNDFDKDNHSDILFFNVSDKRHPYLFINNKNNYFTDFADPYGLNNLSFNGFFSYAFDLNGDSKTEIITADYGNETNYLNIYEKIAGQYQLSFSYTIPTKYASEPIQQLSVTDIDNNGNLDLALVFGYSQAGKGNILFLKNNGFGNFSQFESTKPDLFEGWNVKTIFADFNNDDLDDILFVRNWGSNVIYFRNKKDSWDIYELDKMAPQHPQRKADATAFDFDNDGDLDIFALGENPFITVFENDGRGNFTDITEKSGLDLLNDGEKNGQITSGDFDNNGFIDIFLCILSKGKIENHIFLNDSSHVFRDKSDDLGISNEKIEFAATGDIDGDGDIDLYGFKKGNNVLWINNLDDSNYLRIKLVGVLSNSEAIGAKIWVYESGHIDEPEYLIGYRQIGSQLLGLNHQNEMTSHLGIGKHHLSDVVIKFPSGKIKILKAISSGKSINLAELSAPWSWWYSFEHKAYILLKNNEFQDYLKIVLLGLLSLLISCYYGYRRFQWNFPLINLIASVNLIVFILLLGSLSSAVSTIKYYIPLTVIILGSLGPLGFFYWIKDAVNIKSQEQQNYDLFQLLLNFTHGAWALSNLNSLQLFFENLSVEEINEPTYKTPFEKRKETFINLTFPLLNQIISSSKSLKINTDIELNLEKCTNKIVKTLESDFTLINVITKEQLSISIINLKEFLSKLNKIVFAKYICNPAKIIENIQNELNTIVIKDSVQLNIVNLLSEDATVLIDPTELASIIDNCIQNALKSMQKNTDKKLTLKLLNGDTRIYIEITDNGAGIPKDDFQKIFENGYSTNKSSGYGLFYSKETLSKYGGRIYVKTSTPRKNTTLVIELQKGSKNEAININY
ncbi:MAG TPA: hypothetical protein DCG75_15510 [Bacteroidales bacterium]|nr:hypothetical protein [Bacteroidales bacterium]